MKRFFIITTSVITFCLPILVSAQAVYKPLVGIPGVNPSSDFDGYINSLYALSISIAALLAVIKIVIAGVKWMTTDVVTSKGDAKKDIQGALIGLLIVLAAVLILTVINPNLTKVDLTLNNPATMTTSGSSAAVPTLDTTVISSLSVPGTATVVSYTASTDPTQQQLFFNSCTTNKDGVTNPQSFPITTSAGSRCVKYSPTEEATVMPTNCIVTDCVTVCQTDHGAGAGKYAVDSIDPKVGYCVR